MSVRGTAAWETLVRKRHAWASPVVAVTRPTRRSVQLVVVENGANDLGDQAPARDGEQLLVIAQTRGELPLDFVKRAMRRIWALEQHQSIIRTILLLSPRFDPEAMAARLCLVRALMAHSAAAAPGRSELLIQAGGDFQPQLQSKVLALMEAMIVEPNASALSITVQFAPDGDPFSQQPLRSVDLGSAGPGA